jgi:hypothetical protein
VDRLTARAFALLIEPAGGMVASEALFDLAHGDVVALQRAQTRLEARLLERPTVLAEGARVALRGAVDLARERSTKGG